jgi:hypothetical protein
MKIHLIGFKYFKTEPISRFNGIKLSGVKFLGFSFIHYKNEYTTMFIYLFTLCFNINLRTNDKYDDKIFHYYGPERKILKSIYRYYTDFFGIQIKGKDFIGFNINKQYLVRKFKPTIISEKYLTITFTLFYYKILIDIYNNYR